MNLSSFDFIVVGAGSAGCVLANRLSTLGTVLLLEAGRPVRSLEVSVPAAFSKLYKTEVDWDFESGPEPGAEGRRLYVPRGRMIGGSSSMNAMIYIRGRPSDYQNWEESGADGWGWAEAKPAFLSIEDNARGPGPHHAVGGELRVEDQRDPSDFSRRFIEAALAAGIPANHDFNGAIQEGVGLFQVTQRGGRRWSAADAFLRPARHRPTLSVVTGALVDRIIVEGERARGVCYMVDGEMRIANADAEIVLAAGSIGSPTILQRSGIGDPSHLAKAGVRPIADLPQVGENLQDHPVVMVVYASTRRGTLEDAETIPNLLRYLATRRGPLSSNVAEAGAFVRTNESGAEPDIQFHFGPTYFVDHGLTPFDGNAFTTGPLLLNPASRGWVRIRDADPAAAPEIVGNHLTEAQDIPPLIEGIGIAREIFAQSAFEPVRGPELFPGPEVRTTEQLRSYLRERLELLYHPVGTCRMGRAGQAVVDPRLRVYGIVGLRVADASVMPTVTSGNTNAPTVMIGTRAADLITADHDR